MQASLSVSSVPASLAQACNVVIEKLSPHAGSQHEQAREDFRNEVLTLRKFIDLIERVWRAKPPRLGFEQEHWDCVLKLLGRCQGTLERLCGCFGEEERLKKRKPVAAGVGEERGVDFDFNSAAVVVLRGQIGLFTRVLQMSLQTINLVHQWKSQLSQDGIYFHWNDLSETVQGLRESMMERRELYRSSSGHEDALWEEESLFRDVERCLISADSIMSITTSTVYENSQSPFLLSPQEAINFVDRRKEDMPSPLRIATPSKEAGSPPTKSGSFDESRSPILPHTIETRGLVDRTKDVAPSPLKVSTTNRDEISIPPRNSRRPSPLRDSMPSQKEIPTSNPKRAISNVKHQGGSDSDGDSIIDPESGDDDGFPAEVYAQIIATLQQDVQRELHVGEYQKAENCHRKAMKHLIDRERTLGIPFENRTEMNEILVEVYLNQKQLDKAKRVLNRLLMQEKEETLRKWKLYHLLATIYNEQDRMLEAEKFAKRAFKGREKSLEKGHPSVLESVTLLIRIYQQQGETETAEALRKIYHPKHPLSPLPSTIRSLQPRGPQELESPHSSQSSHFPHLPDSLQRPPVPQKDQLPPSTPIRDINKKGVRWGPDAWVDPSSIDAPTKSGETPLIAAIASGDDEMVRIVLQRGADVEARCADETTPLMHAVTHGYETIADVLLNNGCNVDATTAGWTALHKAADTGNLAMVRRLLAHRANIEASSPKTYVLPNSAMARMRASTFSDAGSDNSDASENDKRWTALLRAAANGEEAMARLLLDGGAEIEARGPSNGTPLMCAAEGKYTALIDLLLIRGASVTACDEFGWTPLHRALVTRGGESAAQLLIDHDASVNARCSYRKTPLHYAIEKGDDSMVCFLVNSGADIEARDIAEQTPLHTAIECRLESIVRLLLDSGADTTAMDQDGRNALMVATKTLRKSPEIIALLTKHEKMSKSGGGVGGRKASVSTSSSKTTEASARSSKSSWFSMRSSKSKGGSNGERLRLIR